MKYIAIVIFILAAEIPLTLYANEAIPDKPKSGDAYVPGMGEIMGATQMRHAKLWFAGKAENWDLANYEIDEIEEGLDDAAKYHPIFKNDAQIATMLKKFTKLPLRDTRAAIEAKDSAKFIKSFSKLTRACNDCHQAASQGFIVIKQPGPLSGSYSNQEFQVR